MTQPQREMLYNKSYGSYQGTTSVVPNRARNSRGFSPPRPQDIGSQWLKPGSLWIGLRHGCESRSPWYKAICWDLPSLWPAPWCAGLPSRGHHNTSTLWDSSSRYGKYAVPRCGRTSPDARCLKKDVDREIVTRTYLNKTAKCTPLQLVTG